MAEKDGNDPVVGMGKVLLVVTITAAGLFGLWIVLADALNYMPRYIFLD